MIKLAASTPIFIARDKVVNRSHMQCIEGRRAAVCHRSGSASRNSERRRSGRVAVRAGKLLTSQLQQSPRFPCFMLYTPAVEPEKSHMTDMSGATLWRTPAARSALKQLSNCFSLVTWPTLDVVVRAELRAHWTTAVCLTLIVYLLICVRLRLIVHIQVLSLVRLLATQRWEARLDADLTTAEGSPLYACLECRFGTKLRRKVAYAVFKICEVRIIVHVHSLGWDNRWQRAEKPAQLAFNTCTLFDDRIYCITQRHGTSLRLLLFDGIPSRVRVDINYTIVLCIQLNKYKQCSSIIFDISSIVISAHTCIVSDHYDAILPVHVYCTLSSMHSVLLQCHVSITYVRIVTVPFVVRNSYSFQYPSHGK